MKWCNLYNCWCDEVEDIIDELGCDGDCKNCEESESLS